MFECWISRFCGIVGPKTRFLSTTRLARMHPHLVFVYGSLKKGEPNHGWLSQPGPGQAVFHGRATTVQSFPLIIASRYNIPYLLAAPGLGHRIQGEIYNVDEAMLKHLDVLEDAPKYYVRQRETAEMADTREQVECWLYVLPDFKEGLLEGPFYHTYSAKAIPDKCFVARHLRTDHDYYWEVKKDGSGSKDPKG